MNALAPAGLIPTRGAPLARGLLGCHWLSTRGAPLVCGLLGCLWLSTGAAPVGAQVRDSGPDDLTTLDGILQAYYDVVSGPAGERPDRERDRALHHPDALVSIAGRDADGAPTIRTMTLDGYHDLTAGPRERGFYEYEIHRQVQRHGNVAHVWSTYASATAPGADPFTRGVNSIQLFFDGARWWITSWVFDGTSGLEVATDYLPG